MNRNTLLWGIVVIIVVVLGVWYFSSLSGDSPSMTATTTATTTASTTPTTTTSGSGNTGATKSTFKSIFTQSGNYECDYSQVSSSSSATSVIYLADGKMRGEFRSSTGSGTSATFMIYNGGYLYSWKEAASTGTKTSIKALADLPSVIPQDLTSAAIYGATGSDSVGWNCHPWAKNTSIFTVPTYVTFK